MSLGKGNRMRHLTYLLFERLQLLLFNYKSCSDGETRSDLKILIPGAGVTVGILGLALPGICYNPAGR